MVDSKRTIVRVLTESYADLVKHLSRRLGGSADAADVVQDTYLRIQNIPAETEIRNPRSYLFRMAENVAVDHLRSQATRQRHFPAGEIEDIEDDQVSAERTVDYRQRLALLQRAVAALPERQRQVFLMHKFDNLSHSQIAD